MGERLACRPRRRARLSRPCLLPVHPRWVAFPVSMVCSRTFTPLKPEATVGSPEALPQVQVRQSLRKTIKMDELPGKELADM